MRKVPMGGRELPNVDFDASTCDDRTLRKSRKTGAEMDGAESGALGARDGLNRVIDAWLDLPESVQAAILTLVSSADRNS